MTQNCNTNRPQIVTAPIRFKYFFETAVCTYLRLYGTYIKLQDKYPLRNTTLMLPVTCLKCKLFGENFFISMYLQYKVHCEMLKTTLNTNCLRTYTIKD